MIRKLMNLFKDEEGVTALEYGLIAALIAVAIIGAVELLGGELNTTFTNVKDKMVEANNPS